MKIVNFTEEKDKREGHISAKELIKDLLESIEKGEVESVIYIVREKDGSIVDGHSALQSTEAIGMLEIAKTYFIDRMRE